MGPPKTDKRLGDYPSLYGRPRGKEAAAAASFPLRGWSGLEEPPNQTELGPDLTSIYTQNVTSPEEGGGHLDRYTVTDMCVDLACCLDPLEQDLVVLYQYHYNTCLVLRAYLGHSISILTKMTRFHCFPLAITRQNDMPTDSQTDRQTERQNNFSA